MRMLQALRSPFFIAFERCRSTRCPSIGRGHGLSTAIPRGATCNFPRLPQEDLRDAWQRYLLPGSAESEPAEPGEPEFEPVPF